MNSLGFSYQFQVNDLLEGREDKSVKSCLQITQSLSLPKNFYDREEGGKELKSTRVFVRSKNVKNK